LHTFPSITYMAGVLCVQNETAGNEEMCYTFLEISKK